MSQRRILLVLLLLTGTVVRPAWGKTDAENAKEEPAPPVGSTTPRRTLAERIPSVTHRAFTKAGRFQIMPAVGISLNDPFFHYTMPTLGLSYHLFETFAIGLSAEYYGALSSQVQVTGGAVLPTPTFNKPSYAARVEVEWSPLYGKISWLAEGVLHFDTYLSLGGGIVGVTSGNSSLGVSLAIGQHYFLNEWIALRFELREQVYNLARSPNIAPTPTLQNLLTASAGLCFYLPSDTEDL